MKKAFMWNVNINGKTLNGNSRAAQFTQHKVDLGPSAEYWLARLTREHASRLFILAFLVLAIIFAVALQPLVNPPAAVQTPPSTTIINNGVPEFFERNGSVDHNVEVNTDGNTFIATFSGTRIEVRNGVVTKDGVVISPPQQ